MHFKWSTPLSITATVLSIDFVLSVTGYLKIITLITRVGFCRLTLLWHNVTQLKEFKKSDLSLSDDVDLDAHYS